MATNTELKTSIDALNSSITQLIDQRRQQARDAAQKASESDSARKGRMVESYDERARQIRKEIDGIYDKIGNINDRFYHQRNIIDEINDSQKEVNDLTKEHSELQKKFNEVKQHYNETDEKYLKAKEKLEQSELKLAKARLDLLEKQQKKEIEGYNKLDEFSEDFENRTKALKKGINEIKDGAKKIGDSILKIVGPWAKMSQAAADFAKNIGLSGKGMDQLRKASINLVANRGIGGKYNTSVEELIGLQQSYTKGVGRQVGLTGNDLETLAATSKILGNEGATDLMAKFEKFGLSMEDAGSRAGKMFADASKRGIAWENYSKNFLDNITLAQRYTFRNGTRGLESMARKATEINLNMSQAASFAEKVNTVEGAIRTGAQLQVLGGPFAQMSDPIGMLYESLNDMEGLQDRMVQMFGNLGSFNRQTGEVEISAFNRMRIREAARSMGLDESNLFESINSNARRNEIARQLQGNAGLSKEVQDLVKNTGTIRNGVAGVTINGQFKAAKDITNADQQALVEISRSESDDIKDIAVRLRGWEDSMQGLKKQRDAIHGQVVESMGIGQGVQNLMNDVAEMKGLLKALAYGTMIAGAAGIIGGAFGMVKGASHVTKGVGNVLGLRGGSAPNVNVKGRTGHVHGYNYEGGKLVNSTTGKAIDAGKLDAVAGKGSYAKLLKGAKLGKTAAAVSKGANIAGWVGLAGEIGTDYYVSKDKNRRGRTVDYAGHIGSGALGGAAMGNMIGGAIGSVVPVIGNAVGALVGTAIGAVAGGVIGYNKARKNQLYRKIYEEGGIDLAGNYSKKELKQIRAAAKGEGEISDKLREKMQMQGDAEMLNKLDTIAKQIITPDGAVKTKVVGAQKRAGGGIIEGASTTGDQNVVMSNAGEMMLNEQQQQNLFNAINNNELGRYQAANQSLSVSPTANITPRVQDVSVAPPVPAPAQTMKVEFGKLDINFKADDIHVISPNGKTEDIRIDIDALTKQIEQNLMLKISEQLERMNHGGRLVPEKGYFYQQK